MKLSILFPRFRCLTPRATKNFSGKYTSSNFNTNVLRKPDFLVKNCFFKEMGPLIFLSRVEFSRETVSDLFYLLKIDDLTFLRFYFLLNVEERRFIMLDLQKNI